MIKKFEFIPKRDSIAYYNNDTSVSFNQVRENIGYVSGNLGDLSNKVVWIFGKNSLEWIYSFYAVWNCGGICVPVDYSLDEAELDHILKDSEPDLILTSVENKNNLEDSFERINFKTEIKFFSDIIQQNKFKELSDSFDYSKTALIVYTSGTTGKSKGVMLSFESVIFNLMGVVQTDMMVEGDRYIVMFPFHHTVPLQGHVICPLYIGAQGIFLNEISPTAVIEIFQKYKITLLNGVPRLYNLFHKAIMEKINSSFIIKRLFKIAKIVNSVKFSKFIFSKVHQRFGGEVKVFLSGGAPLEKDVVENFRALGIPLVEGYGMTEMGPLISYNLLTDYKAGTVGKPVNGVEVKVENGEILARSPGMMQGYYRNSQATSDVIIEGWCHTGDRGEFDSHGYLKVTGRVKEMIVLSSGKNINPEDIEDQIYNISSAVSEVAVILKNEALFAVVVPDHSFFKTSSRDKVVEKIKWEVFDKYNSSVPSWKRIFDFAVVDSELPRTALGKIRRFMLNDLISSPGKDNEDSVVIDDPETNLIARFIQPFTSSSVRADSHLQLDLGLDSMALLELKVFLHNEFGIYIENANILADYTPGKLAEDIRNQKFDITDHKSGLQIPEYDKPVVLKHSSLRFRLMKWVINNLFLGMYIRIRRIGKVEKKQNFIYACNHQSFLDPFLVARSLPNKTLKQSFFIAKARHFSTKVGRFVLKNVNAIITDKKENTEQLLGESAAVLKNGNNLVIFPEGTRSYDGKLLPFKKSFAVLSKELNIPVVPVAIKGSNNLLPRMSSFPKPGKVCVKFMDPIYPDQLDVDTIVNETEKSIREVVS